MRYVPGDGARVIVTAAIWAVAMLVCAVCMVFVVWNPAPPPDTWYSGLVYLLFLRFPQAVLFLAIVLTFRIWWPSVRSKDVRQPR